MGKIPFLTKTSTVTTQDPHGSITPHVTVSNDVAGTITFNYLYEIRSPGGVLAFNPSNGLLSTKINPSNLQITEQPVSNVPSNTNVSYDVTPTLFSYFFFILNM